MKRMRYSILVAAYVLAFGAFLNPAHAQPEVKAWGNLTGIRVDGQLMAFGSSLRVVGSDWSRTSQTAKERQRPHYTREGNRQIVTTRIDSLFFTEIIEDRGDGTAAVTVQATSHADTSIAGAFFTLELPGEGYSDGTVTLVDPASPAAARLSLASARPNGRGEYLRATAGGVRFTSPHRRLEVAFSGPEDVIVRRGSGQEILLYLPLFSGDVTMGQTAEKTFTIRASGDADRSPVTLTLDSTKPGRPFAGIGGNFRLQNPDTDPQVIDYNLEHLRVAWGRVEMPWRFWQPDEDIDPVAAAEAGNLHPRVQRAMEMARRLSRMGMPVILSDWSAPDWAIVGSRSFRPRPDGLHGNPLNPEKTDQIYASIAAYVTYLKDHYGVEATAFSFNESDIGIDVLQTAEEHAALIEGLGAYFASKGLKTKLLLGDTGDANGYPFIEAALNDPAARPYIAAVSFHSWRGWADTTLAKWADAASRLNLPLIVAEGSIDAAAWRYPDIFEEPTYALEEINLYTRILALCQPRSILQWQLTADYSDMAGGGIFGNDEPLHPTQRFWNLKQLGSTPAGLFAMPVTADKPGITSAALGDNDRGVYAVHLVNDGPTREATLAGLPDDVHELRIYVTDSTRGMQEGPRVPVSNGQAHFTLNATSFTTLISAR
ncbi:MAG TPA: hypothetical protein VFG50_15630 [Rhodothermales bacterium]|nr:hypothetical protein [Rhodothermales bacterium]